MDNKRLKVLITAGGTSEPIDDVRKITNTSTGRLGSLISAELIKAGAEVTYVTTKSALPPFKGCDIKYVTTAGELYLLIKSLLEENRYDVVVHAMAVSDYSVSAVTTLGDMYDSFKSVYKSGESKDNWQAKLICGERAVEPKIPSGQEDAVIILRPTKKVISLIKELQPETLLIGFKLLAGSDEKNLMMKAKDLIEKNNCDYIVANDINGIDGDRHKALIISADGSFVRCDDKQEIARKISEIAGGRRNRKI